MSCIPRRRRYVLVAAGVVLVLCGIAAPDAAQSISRILSVHHGQASRKPASQVIKHIVFIMEENRSFDNIFGRFPGADGVITATVATGGHQTTIPLLPEPYYLWHDLGHDLYDAEVSIDHGKMDGFSRETYSDLFGEKAVYQQLMPGNVPDLYAYARHFTLSDRTFAPVPGSTFPTHLHMVAAQDGGTISNPQDASNAWGCDAVAGTTVLIQKTPGHFVKRFPCFTFQTMADTFSRTHVSWTYYASPPSDLGYIWSTLDAFKQIRETPLWGNYVRDERSFEADARAGRLPAFSWVTPRAAASMHPPIPVCPGENWIVDKVNAVMSGPDWNSTMIVLAWDDWGGYYDHVPPPPGDAMVYGMRVPLLIISPYARPGYVSHTVYTFESVLKTAEELWGLPPLTDADRSAHDLLDSLDVTQAPLAPLLLKPRACPPALTQAQDRGYLDQTLQHILTTMLGLPMPRIEALHRTKTLADIARARGVDPLALAAVMKSVAGAWAGGEVMLQFVEPLDEGRETYLAMRGIDKLLQAAPGTRILPLY